MLTSLTLQDGRLSPAQQEQYWEEGYLFPLPALPAALARDYRGQLEGIERDWLDAGLPLPLNTYKRINAHVVCPWWLKLPHIQLCWT
ncbi:MAG: hypothetical protein AAFU41_08675 [Pseudomonadota bacterium]